jgi:NADH-quinone oxidoreductase subunit H
MEHLIKFLSQWPWPLTGGPVLDSFLSIFLVAFILVNFAAVYSGMSTYLERKIAGHMQSRVGPYRIGPHGILVWIADALKLLIKEDIIAKETDRFLFRLSPYVVFAGAFACFVALPFAPYWSPAGLNIGLLYLLAVSSSGVIGILMAGWASGNKWALFGAMRSAAQIVSYEVPVGITLLGMLFIYGSLDMHKIAAAQTAGMPWGFFPDWQGGLWSWGILRYFPFTFIAFLVYYIGALAETNRTPFDIPEAESELVAGYHTEYSGMRWSYFFLAEYVNMFTVSAIAATVFLGGWLPPFPNVPSAAMGVVGGLVVAGFAYGRKRQGFDAVVGFTAGLAVGVFAGVVRTHWGGTAEAGDVFLIARFAEGLFWFAVKVISLLFLMMWLRWTLPRYRVDQLMDLCWKKLTPLALANLLVIGVMETRASWWSMLWGKH